jgi:hypothetical protein
MPVDLLAELDVQIAAAEETLIRLRNARAALANHRGGKAIELPTVAGPAVESLPLTQAIRQVLQWNYDRGREVMTVGDVYEVLRPHKVTTANGKSLWDSELPWKAYVICCTSPHNQAKYWTVSKSISGDRAKLLKTDTICIKPVQRNPR